MSPQWPRLRACGASPDTADQKPPAPIVAEEKVYKESVKDLLDAELLEAGTVLQPMRKGLTQTALVLTDGNLKVGEQVVTAVSPAAMAVSGNKSAPGWDFWGAPSGEGGYVPLFELRERLREGSSNVQPSGIETGAPGAVSSALPGTPVDPDMEPLATKREMQAGRK